MLEVDQKQPQKMILFKRNISKKELSTWKKRARKIQKEMALSDNYNRIQWAKTQKKYNEAGKARYGPSFPRDRLSERKLQDVYLHLHTMYIEGEEQVNRAWSKTVLNHSDPQSNEFKLYEPEAASAITGFLEGVFPQNSWRLDVVIPDDEKADDHEKLWVKAMPGNAELIFERKNYERAPQYSMGTGTLALRHPNKNMNMSILRTAAFLALVGMGY